MEKITKEKMKSILMEDCDAEFTDIQAERVIDIVESFTMKVVSANKSLQAQIDELQTKLDKAVEALEYMSNQDASEWMSQYFVDKAGEALKEIEGE
jgi:hypothetical protein